VIYRACIASLNLTIGAYMDQVRADIKLSTGRIVKHTRQENGSQLATPTPGCYEMTNQEWIEYCKIINGGYIPRYPILGEDLTA